MRIVLLVAVLVIAGCDSQPPKTAADVNQIIRLADEAMHVVQKISAGAPAADVDAAVEQMNAALDTARAQIEAVGRRISVAKYYGRGSIDPRDLGACIDTVINTPLLGRMPNDIRGPLLMSTVECVSKMSAYFSLASGEDAAAVALAISVIDPLLMVAEAQGGVPAESRLADYRASSQEILAKLASECGDHPAGAEQMSYECAAYEVARSVEPKLATFAAELPTAQPAQ
ncbi:MAG TPA: hypothetical protein VJT80_23450 [Steroidobacteraceae bacterium]|nr:hypothetical protein [Steroidobacteraceae bacterium]